MAKLTTDEIIDALKEMTLLEASELVKAIEDTFGVSAAAPAAVVAAPAAGAAEAEEKTEFDVVLEGFGDNKIQVIKAVRELTNSLHSVRPSPDTQTKSALTAATFKVLRCRHKSAYAVPIRRRGRYVRRIVTRVIHTSKTTTKVPPL